MPHRRGGRFLTADEIARIRELRYAHGLTIAETVAYVGRSPMTVQRVAPGRPGKVDNAALREAFLRSGRSAADVARAAGWTFESGGRIKPDSSRVRRTLGLIDDVSAGGWRSRRKLIDAETAEILADAVGVAPWTVIDEPSMGALASR